MTGGLSINNSRRNNAPAVAHKAKRNDGNGGGGGDDNDNDDVAAPFLSALPGLFKVCFRSAAVATVALYVLNQKRMLPRPIGAFASRLLFWPTLPITLSRRVGRWMTPVDETVVLGGAPFGFLGYPDRLVERYGVKGVVNMCDEYSGPASAYRRLGVEHLRLPTTDHFEPSVEDLKRAVSFIQKHEAEGGKVYVHCRAGHGRSAAAVYAWLLYKEPLADPEDLNEKLCGLRNVRKSIWKQPNVNAFRTWLQSGGDVDDAGIGGDEGAFSNGDHARKRHRRSSRDIIRPERSSRSADEWDTGFVETNSSSDDWDSSDQESYDALEDDKIPLRNSGLKDKGLTGKSLGQVFSDEYDTDDTDEYYYSEDEIPTSDQLYDDDYSADEKDYQMWKKYQDGDR